jgi:hypothetical protein
MNNLFQHIENNINLKEHTLSKRTISNVSNMYTLFNSTKILPHNISLSRNISFGNHFNYIPGNFNTYIYNNMHFKSTITTRIKSKNINIHFFQEIKYFQNKQQIHRVLKLLNFLIGYSSSICSKNLDIYIYLTPFKKTLPINNQTQIKQINVNTGFTFACKGNNEIHIYRKEEWFKVFIHECIHAFGLDFSAIPDNTLNTFFKINSDLQLSEAYCETLTIIIQTFFIKHKGDFIEHFKSAIYNETLFTLTQSAKILNHNNTDLVTMMNSKTYNNYNEDTPIFSYFIIKSIYLYFINDFFELSIRLDKNILKNNFNNNDVALFSNLIKKKATHKKYLNDLHFVQSYIKRRKIIHNTLKFSFYG